MLDIAWLIYEHRLSLAGYPFARLHPHVHAWAEKLRARPEFAKEIAQLRHSPDQLDDRPARPGRQDVGNGRGVLEHDPEKWNPVSEDHAPLKCARARTCGMQPCRSTMQFRRC